MDIGDLFTRIASAVFVLSVLIAVHELGHFLAAKFFGVGVVEFAIGFGKKIFSKRFGETIYSLRLIPLGGFVRMVGEDPRMLQSPDKFEELRLSMDPHEAKLWEDKSKWFSNKSYLPKATIVFAGPLFNFLFAIILSFASLVLFGIDEIVDKPIIGSISKDFPAEKAGILPNDKVLKIGEDTPKNWEDLALKIKEYQGKKMTLLIERKADSGSTIEKTISITGKEDDSELAELMGTKDDKSFKIGIGPSFKRKSVDVGYAAKMATYHVVTISTLSLTGFVKMITGSVSSKNLRGPIFILGEAGATAKRGIEHMFGFMIVLSVSLAVLNLLPIPVLDGGHLLIFTIEAIKRSPISIQTQERVTQFGMLILLLLMAFALGNDIIHLFGG
jgi:regulator of sigma E protease